MLIGAAAEEKLLSDIVKLRRTELAREECQRFPIAVH